MSDYEEELRRLGERIRRLRKQKRLTQRELAEKAGVFDVGELERARKVKGGTVNPRLETLWRIAQALDAGLAELIGGEALDEDAEMISRLLQGIEESTRRKVISVVKTMCS